MQDKEQYQQQKPKEDQPVPFKTWSGWYLLVAGVLVILILLFYLFTKQFQ